MGAADTKLTLFFFFSGSVFCLINKSRNQLKNRSVWNCSIILQSFAVVSPFLKAEQNQSLHLPSLFNTSNPLRPFKIPTYSGYVHTEVFRVSFSFFPSTKPMRAIISLDPFPLRSIGAVSKFSSGACEWNSEILAVGFSVSFAVPKKFSPWYLWRF